MKKEDLLNDYFLKQFTTGDELHDFLKQIQKRGSKPAFFLYLSNYYFIRIHRTSFLLAPEPVS